MNAAALRKGWCPGALRPMDARDGLIVRLRIAGGILSAATAMAIADLSERFGNAQIDLSARANLQLRGVEERTLPALWDALTALGLLDADPAAEAVRNVLASPLAGCHAGLDLRPVVAALERRLTEDAALHALPAKILFLVDDGGRPSLAPIAADIRFDWMVSHAAFSIGLGGAGADALRIGSCQADDLPDRAADIARGVIALQRRWPDARRVRELIRQAGTDKVAEACGGTILHEMKLPHLRPNEAIVGPRTFSGLPTLGLAAPFGRLTAKMLAAAAGFAASTPQGELRLTPWRALLVPGTTERPDLEGFIVDPTDPRLPVAACVGKDGCAQASTDTRIDAVELAGLLPTRTDDAIGLHISGCAKGCARPDATRVTLVGRDGRYDLVRNGRAGDPSDRRGLDLAAVRALLTADAT